MTEAAGNQVGVLINQSWTGAIGQLVRQVSEYFNLLESNKNEMELQQVDLVACPFAINLQRYKAIQFVAYIGFGSTVMLTKYPDSELSAMATVETFSWQVVATSAPQISH